MALFLSRDDLAWRNICGRGEDSNFLNPDVCYSRYEPYSSYLGTPGRPSFASMAVYVCVYGRGAREGRLEKPRTLWMCGCVCMCLYTCTFFYFSHCVPAWMLLDKLMLLSPLL